MTQNIPRILMLLAVSSFAPAALGANPPGPPAIANGIAMLQDAKANLQNAGDKWGPHRENAIEYIDQALDVCGVTQTPGNGELKSGSWANLTLLQTAITQVTTAQKNFKNAKSTWGGRRDKALPFITQALQELQLAISLAPGLNTVSNPTPSGTPGSTTSSTTPSANQQPNPNPPAAASAGTTPPMIATGIFNLQTAIANLQSAGNYWGPHLVNALNDINQALEACGVAPPPPPSGDMTSQPWANTTLMTLGTQRVTSAQKNFKNAKSPWGGRRDKALPFITQALQELQQAAASYTGPTVSNPPT